MAITFCGCRRTAPQPKRSVQKIEPDPYRVLTAVDNAVMALDPAKGDRGADRKLFEVRGLRDVPILTFVHKLDREG